MPINKAISHSYKKIKFTKDMPTLILGSVRATPKFKSNSLYKKITKQRYHHMEKSNFNSRLAKEDHYTLASLQQGKLEFIMIMGI